MSLQLLPKYEIEAYVLGGLIADPSLILQTNKYKFSESEFMSPASKSVFKTISWMLFMDFTPSGIQFGAIKAAINSRGEWNDEVSRYLQTCYDHRDLENFDYYYSEFKKSGLVRELGKEGFLVKQNDWEVDPCFLMQGDKYQDCRDMTSEETMELLRDKLNSIENKYIICSNTGESKAADNIRELVDELKQNPEVGATLQGNVFNSICRGARLGKLYLRSAQSGVGKTRSMVGDACNLAYPIKFDNATQQWVATGSNEKVLYVMTEQDPEEIKTMVLAYLSGINEEHFLYNTVSATDAPKVEIAMRIMEKYKDNLLFAQIPDPSASVVQNLFRRHSQKGVKYFFYDYIFSSPAMLDEYKSMGISESVALRMFTTTLKNLATELNAFILTSTQLSNDFDQKTGGFKDYHQIRGSKSIQDLTDFACIMSRPSPEELKLLENACEITNKTPNLVTDVFKNRRGRWTMVRIWSVIDLGTCQKEDLFITTAAMGGISNFQFMSLKPEISDDCQHETNSYNQLMKQCVCGDFNEILKPLPEPIETSPEPVEDLPLPEPIETSPEPVEDLPLPEPIETSPEPVEDLPLPEPIETPPESVEDLPKQMSLPEPIEAPPEPVEDLPKQMSLPEPIEAPPEPVGTPPELTEKPPKPTETSPESTEAPHKEKSDETAAPPKKKSIFPDNIKWFWIPD